MWQGMLPCLKYLGRVRGLDVHHLMDSLHFMNGSCNSLIGKCEAEALAAMKPQDSAAALSKMTSFEIQLVLLHYPEMRPQEQAAVDRGTPGVVAGVKTKIEVCSTHTYICSTQYIQLNLTEVVTKTVGCSMRIESIAVWLGSQECPISRVQGIRILIFSSRCV